MENIVWKFVVEGKKVEVVSTEKKTDALVELGLALGLGGQQRKSILNNIYLRKPKLIGQRLLE